MIRISSMKLAVVFVFLILLLLWVRVGTDQLKQSQPSFHTWTNEFSPLADKMVAGSLPGLMADFHILDVFSVYYDARKSGKLEDMQYIATYLKRAQNLDPKFFDIYRLAGSLLAYDAKMPKEAVEILRIGIQQRPDSWEPPVYAGFIAHDMLKNDKLAFELMSEVATREGTPTFVITLASQFLASSSTNEDAIHFLKGLLQLIPKGYHDGIRKRIRQLEEEILINSTK